jgi:predicted Fe-Mo cluster-binding NifX family protein
MKRKIAIPLENGKLCQHFGHCQEFSILEIDENNQVTYEERITPPEHQPGLYPAWVAQHGVTDVITGGMGQKAIDLFHQQKINVYVGAEMKAPNELASDFANNTLNAGANLCNH